MSEEEKKKRPVLSYIITIVIIISGILLFINKDKFSDRKQYFTYFQSVDGLVPGSKVSVNGAVVGKVSNIDLLDSGLKVTLSLGPDVKLANGTIAKLGSSGMSGGKIVQLTPGTAKGFIEENGLIIGHDEKSLLGGQGTLRANIDVAKVMLKAGDSIISEVSTLFGTGAREDINFKLNKLNRQTDEANKTSSEAKGTGEKFAGKIHAINQDVASLANDSKEWSATLADFENKSADLAKSTSGFADNMKELQANIKKFKPVLEKANDKNTSLGKMLNDPQAYHTANKQLKQADTSIKEVMARPAAHWFAIFGKNR